MLKQIHLAARLYVVKLFHGENNQSVIWNGAGKVSLIAHLCGLFYEFLEKEEIKPAGMAERTKYRKKIVCCNIYFAIQHINSTWVRESTTCLFTAGSSKQCFLLAFGLSIPKAVTSFITMLLIVTPGYWGLHRPPCVVGRGDGQQLWKCWIRVDKFHEWPLSKVCGVGGGRVGQAVAQVKLLLWGWRCGIGSLVSCVIKRKKKNKKQQKPPRK